MAISITSPLPLFVLLPTHPPLGALLIDLSGREGGKEYLGGSGGWEKDIEGEGSQEENFPTTRVALVLPKPKELDRAIFTSALLASLGT
jgi:hypothetical protein